MRSVFCPAVSTLSVIRLWAGLGFAVIGQGLLNAESACSIIGHHIRGEILQRGSFLRFNPTCAVGREQCSLNTKMSFATVDLASQLRALRKDCDRDGDFVLTCQGRDIKAHSFILSMRSGPSNKILFIGLNPFFSGVNTSGHFSPQRLDASPR